MIINSNNIYNTCLYFHPKSKKFYFYRPWDCGKGSITSGCSSLKDLINSMEEHKSDFKEIFIPVDKVPKLEDINLSEYKPLAKMKVLEVIDYLYSQEEFSRIVQLKKEKALLQSIFPD